MALRTIRTDDDPVLRKKSRKVEKFDDRLKALVDDMIETMYDADGIGLAAPQVGILRRVIVIDLYDDNGAGVYINPEIIAQSGDQFEIEGCLSLPGLNGRVHRPQRVTVRYQTLDGSVVEKDGEDLLARAFCHEIDHLNGVLFTDNAEILSDEELAELARQEESEQTA